MQVFYKPIYGSFLLYKKNKKGLQLYFFNNYIKYIILKERGPFIWVHIEEGQNLKGRD